jgi:hypothetical protein
LSDTARSTAARASFSSPVPVGRLVLHGLALLEQLALGAQGRHQRTARGLYLLAQVAQHLVGHDLRVLGLVHRVMRVGHDHVADACEQRSHDDPPVDTPLMNDVQHRLNEHRLPCQPGSESVLYLIEKQDRKHRLQNALAGAAA